MSIKHSKYKNTGILFELLTRQITSDILSGNGKSGAIPIVERYFRKGTELGKELVLYRSFFNGKKLSETKALDYINLLVEQRKKLDNKKLKEQKYNLIKEIKDTYDLENFLGNRVPSYKIYASIYKNFECAAQGYTFENVEELSEAKYTLVEYLSGNIEDKKIVVESEVVNTLREQEQDIRMLTYKLMFERFNQKYTNLNSKQKALLREYVSNGSDLEYMLDFARKEAVEVANSIKKKLGQVEQEVQRIKLKEVVHQLEEFADLRKIKNNHLTALMIGYELDSQLNSFQSHE